MSRRRPLRLGALVGLAVSLALRSAAEPPVAVTPASGQPRPGRSPATEALLAKLPKFVPPSFQPSAAAGEAAGQEEDILRLPKMTVRPAPVAPEFDYALINPKGRLELALKANPGIRLGNILGLNEITARTMQREERLTAKKADLADQVRRSTLGDSELDRKIRGLTEALAQRSGTERDFPSDYLPPRETRGRPKR